MITAIVSGWNAVTGWASRNPVMVWIGALILFVLGWEKIKADIKSEAKKSERAAIAKKQAEVQLRMQERSTEIINEERHNADTALQARDRSPDFPSSDLVPDPVARVIFRD